MRLAELTLEKYGAFLERRLDLEGPGLTIVYGPNEAGKSTCLAAIGDFLFRIPGNSPMGLFGNDQMRIGARLVCADGRQLSLKRRKGNGRTLIDETGAPVDDTVLTSLLGATDRNRFASLFGLNHESLRAGGEQLLAADGEIGRLIVEAGGGLRSLMKRLEELDAEATRLFSSRRAGDRAFYQALDAFTAAEQSNKAATLSRDTHEEAQRTLNAARAKLEQLRQDRKVVTIAASGLERLARVWSMLRSLDRIEAELGDYSDAGSLGEGFDQRWSEALRRRSDALDSLQQARGEHEELRIQLEVLGADQPILDAADQVEEIGERSIVVARARQDRPNREKELADAELQLSGLRDRLGLSSIEDLAGRAPSPETLSQVQQLALEAIERRPAIKAAAARVASLSQAIGDAETAIEEAVAAGQDMEIGVAPSAFASLAAQVSSLEARARQAEASQSAILRDAARLGFDDLAGLTGLRVPDADTVAAEIAARDALSLKLASQQELAATSLAERKAAEREIERLQQGPEVATDAALADARAARQSAWAPIRAAHLAGRSDASPEARAAEVEAMSEGLRATDDLADRRTSEAQRVASLMEAQRRRDEAMVALHTAEEAQTALKASLQVREQAFAASFPEAIAHEPSLAALKAFVAARADLLRREDERTRLAADAELLRAELEPALDLLSEVERRLGVDDGSSSPLALRVQSAVNAMGRQDKAFTALQRARQDLARLQSDLTAEERLVRALDGEEAAWLAAWGPLVQRIGATPTLPAESANDLASQWSKAGGVLDAIGQTRRRLTRMDEDEAELRTRVRAVAGALGVTLSEEIGVAANALKVRLRAAQDTDSRRRSLEPQLQVLESRLPARTATAEDAAQAVAALAAECGCSVEEEVEISRRARRYAERRDLIAERDRLLASVRSAGDGEDVEVLKAELGVRDLDQIRGDHTATSARLEEIDSEVEDAIQAEQQARLQLAALEKGEGFTHAVAERESATARMHDVVERYVELRVAHQLITEAVAQVRSQQQDPLIRRAGELFAATTGGRFTGVKADVNAKGDPVVVGVRVGGGRVAVAEMSDGSRDQLFLAFRLASVENYCRSTEPLPFIADDILVHFDDERSSATLELLAETAKVTQVLLFTHHRSVRDACSGLITEGRAHLIDLDQAALAAA